jgi:hypothetical protein
MNIPDAPMPLSECATLRLRRATDYSGLGKTTLYKLGPAGKIQLIKVGGRTLVVRRSLDAFLDERSSVKK